MDNINPNSKMSANTVDSYEAGYAQDTKLNPFSHHGTVADFANIIHDEQDSLEYLKSNMPKSASELEKLSASDETANKLFFNMVRQAFRYVETIIDLQEVKEEGLGTDEHKQKDDERGRCHTATIDSTNMWSRALAKAGIDNGFMSSVLSTPPNRAVYGMFAVGLALDIYTDENFDIEKYKLG